MKKQILIGLVITLNVGCAGNPVRPDNTVLSPVVAELNSYRNSASARCTGSSYEFALGKKISGGVTGSAEISEKLLEKGFGTGSLSIGVTMDEKTEFANLLGRLSNEQVDKFLSSYQTCIDKDMDGFYRARRDVYGDYPDKPKTTSVVWGSNILKASSTVTAYATGDSGNWRSYEACVSIPDNALMLKESVETGVAAGVNAGTWGDWRKDFKFVDSNAYGPTKVCRGFDHQIHDQNRVLYINVSYKLPES